jgi:hypothetical protein
MKLQGSNPQAQLKAQAQKLDRTGKQMQQQAKAIQQNKQPENLTPKVQNSSKLNINA